MSLRPLFGDSFLIRSPIVCTRTILNKYQGTSFYTCRKASLTVEAALVVPFTIGFLAIILFLFRIVQTQAAVEEALFVTGQFIAVEGCVVDSEEVLFLSAKGVFVSTLNDNTVIKDYVEGGNLGITLLGSEFEGNEINLQASYKICFPISFFGNKGIWFTSRNRFVKWVGDASEDVEEEWVYITPNGTVYHATTSCRTLDLTVHEALVTEIEDIRGKDGQKFYPCSSCVERKETTAMVYYTDYGTLYHQNVSCSALKRTVIKIAFSQVQERRGCSYCYP